MNRKQTLLVNIHFSVTLFNPTADIMVYKIAISNMLSKKYRGSVRFPTQIKIDSYDILEYIEPGYGYEVDLSYYIDKDSIRGKECELLDVLKIVKQTLEDSTDILNKPMLITTVDLTSLQLSKQYQQEES